MISPKPTTMLLFMPLVVVALADSEASLPSALAVGATSSSLAVSSTASGSVLFSTSAGSSIFPSTLVSSSSGSPPTSTLLAVPTEASRSTLPISHYSFTPFPTPTQSAVGVFPSTDPKNPPPVHSGLKIVPDFAPAWAAAYKKAEAKVRP